MNKASKLNRKGSENNSSSSVSSSSFLSINKKKKSSPRSPLKDLNSTCISPRFSNEAAPTRGCFSFFNSISSSPKPAPRNSKPLSSKALNKRSNPNLENSKLKNPENRSVPISEDPISGDGHSSKGKLSNHSCLNNSEVVESEKMSTPEKSSSYEADKCLSKTSNSDKTPPIHASISPEITCGSNAAPTPVCFATGHVLTGVQDRRKCRPRGVLTIGEGKEASIQWLSSPSKSYSNFSKFSPSGSSNVSGFSTPINEGRDIRRTPSSNSSISPFSAIVQKDIDIDYTTPLVDTNVRAIVQKNVDSDNTTPLVDINVRKTPSSNSSISPYSTMVQRSEAKKAGRECPYCSITENTPISYSTQSPYSKSKKRGTLSPLNSDSMVGVFENLKSPPKKDSCNVLPSIHELSFQLNSTDVSCSSENLKCDDLYSSDMRISWRDGLVSRIFEMGELDHDEDNIMHLEDEFENSKLKLLESRDNDDKHTHSISGSFEFPYREFGAKENEVSSEYNLCIESFCTDGGLTSSGESDWTLFYKNQLFEASQFFFYNPSRRMRCR